MDEPDFEWLIIDTSHCKVHPYAARTKGSNQNMSCTKKGEQYQNSLCCVCANDMSVRVLIIEGTRADYKEAIHLKLLLTELLLT